MNRPYNASRMVSALILAAASGIGILAPAAAEANRPNQRAEAEVRALDELDWQSAASAADCQCLERYLAGGTAGNFTQLALEAGAAWDCDFSGIAPQIAARAAMAGRPVAERVFRDSFVSVTGQGPEMVALPPGSFTMGSSEGYKQDTEGPQRSIRIGYQLAVGRFEVTFAQWDACVADGGCRTGRGGADFHIPDDEGWGRADRPVINVNRNDAQAYIDWLNTKTGLTGRPDRYRLLSEAEWEYAARAGSQARWSFGNDRDLVGLYAWTSDDSNNRTHPVGMKAANAFGLHDMHGNVQEWTEDCWNPNYNPNYTGAPPSDGSAWMSGDCGRHPVRGGGYRQTDQGVTTTYRNRNLSGNQSDDLGFRVARML